MDEALPRRLMGSRPATQHRVDAEGESAARLHHLFEAHYDSAWRVLRRLGVWESAADDAAQEVFVIVAQRLGDIRPRAERSFVLGTARRVAAAFRRRGQNHPLLQLEELEEREDPAPGVDSVVAARSERRLLDGLLAQFDEQTRELFVLFELEGMSRLEVAQLLGIPEGTAASRLRRAREQFLAAARRLKAQLERTEGGGR